jgi:type I restriction enzyme, S subunit
MSFKLYPKYKDSGIEWLGSVPEGWDTKRLKYCASINDEALAETTDPDTELLYVEIGGVDSVMGITQKEPHLFSAAPSRARRIVRDGDVIVSTVRTYLRAIAPVCKPESNLIVSTGFAVVRARDGLESAFAAYALRAPYFVDNVVARSVGVSYPAINASELGTLFLTLPIKSEQQAIAAFLDRETGRIDELIRKKERQIELLQEKRQSLISHAVTKGLDPNAKLKDSGIEWTSRCPSEWDTLPLFSVMREKETKNTGMQESNVLSLSYGRIIPRDVDNNMGLIPESFETYQIIEPGDIILRLTDLQNDKRSLRVGFVRERGIITSAYTCLQTKERLLPSYTAYLLLAYDLLKVFYGYGGGVRQTMKFEDLKWMPLLLPSFSEQRAIAAFLDRETSHIDELTARIRSSIETLREYRTALISAAVTGKIDVRKEVADTRSVRQASPQFQRAVLAAEIVQQLYKESTFGHVKFQKILYLCENHLGLDLQGDYSRQAAGPFDHTMLRSVDGVLRKCKWFDARKVDCRILYFPMEKAGEHSKYIDRYWGSIRPELNSLLKLLKSFDSEHCEIIATLHAAWNDLISLNQLVSDEDIIREVRENWHERKARFQPERLKKALEWMRSHQLVPKGFGKRTK